MNLENTVLSGRGRSQRTTSKSCDSMCMKCQEEAKPWGQEVGAGQRLLGAGEQQECAVAAEAHGGPRGAVNRC